MCWFMFLYAALLFFVLTPGILLSLPPKGKKMTVAAVHAVVFALVWSVTHKFVMKMKTAKSIAKLQTYDYIFVDKIAWLRKFFINFY